jgi:hypothetical protein
VGPLRIRTTLIPVLLLQNICQGIRPSFKPFVTPKSKSPRLSHSLWRGHHETIGAHFLAKHMSTADCSSAGPSRSPATVVVVFESVAEAFHPERSGFPHTQLGKRDCQDFSFQCVRISDSSAQSVMNMG